MEEPNRLIENLERFDNEGKTLKEMFDLLIEIFKKYIDWDENNHKVLALWVLASFFHDVFETFPYIFLTAMKGSGKSRILKLCSVLCEGDFTVNISAAALFRERLPLFLDEAENLRRKEKYDLREVLNAAYKKGGAVIRMKKKDEFGNQEPVKLPVYRPIMLANIDGIDDVLADRCINLSLEKSFNPEITRRVELFSIDKKIKRFLESKCRLVQCIVDVELIYALAAYYFSEYPPTLYTNLQDYLSPSLYINLHQSTYNFEEIIEKINGSNMLGRDLEIWLPIFTTAASISTGLLDEAIVFARENAIERRTTDVLENKDVVCIAFLDYFIKDRNIKNDVWIRTSEIVDEFMVYNPKEEWFNSQWLGIALRRNRLVLKKRRQSKGMEVIFDLEKINTKAKRYDIEEIQKQFASENTKLSEYVINTQQGDSNT